MTTDDTSVARWRDAETLRMALEAAGMGLWSWDASSDAVTWDDQTCLIFGCEPGTGPATYAEYLTMIHPDDRGAVDEAIAEALRTGVYRDVEHRIARPDGAVRWLVGKGALFRSANGALLRIIGGIVDITQQVEAERKEAQRAASLMQAHQMEMVGRLAGGLAHDFNNFLTVINGYTELLLAELSATDPHRETLHRILGAGQSAAELTGQLLAYGRKQVLQPKVLDLNGTLTALRPLLSRIAGENVELKLELSSATAAVRADPLQLEQVIMNLVLNARDAMPYGGELLVAVDCEDRKIVLTVTDNGLGMDEETLRRVFEPFFTTRELGKGTGLGMSIVQGIVAQSGGTIEVRSHPGRGTTFLICLPEATDIVTEEAARPESVHVLHEQRNVMVVEDKPEVRDYAAAVLTNFGYRVIKADNAFDALLLCGREQEHIDLVLADVVMPGLSGPEMGARMKGLRPGIKILYMSGYTADKIAHHGILDPETDFIQKPFTPRQLSGKVHEILERSLPARS